MLATAVWRNIFKASEDVDFFKLAQVVSYMRSVICHLAEMDDSAIASADIIFSDPSSEASVVEECSRQAEEDGEPGARPQKVPTQSIKS